ncbi:MAG TPA: serine/threonine-protein kinase, partial [Thermomicrobiales bacterium]|nr:serine/threonine-protein kinase [Thermomicrobiales bacterium]
MDRLVGTALGRYQIEALIGEGGMAAVYRARDPVFERIVAIKVVHPLLVRDRLFAERFLREARAAARLQHPHILPVHDFGTQDDVAYLVMPFVEAGTLQNRLGAPLDVADAIALLRPIADALDYAHLEGVIHRDVKPANILLTSQGLPLLADFGVAKVIGDTTLTGTGVQPGTALYLSPEQAQGKPLDGRSDLYSLGLILYEALTGRPPFEPGPHDTPFSLVLRHIAEQPPAPRSFNPALNTETEQVLLRALAKPPEER